VAALYSDVIVDRFRHPRRKGSLDRPDASHEDVNPLCGDRIRMEVRLAPAGQGTLGAVRFQGDACAIAVASADLLAEMAEGRPAAEVARLDRQAILGALGATIRASRLQCVSLPLHVLRSALGNLPG
jgi:nitrogen fixation NifU-like protein